MEGTTTAILPQNGGPPMRGGYRGRGMNGPPMRGGYDRGRGRGGRGHYMGGGGRGGGPMNMGGPPPPPNMMPGGRIMRPPRGMGYQGRGYIPRGNPSMRGGRPPMYAPQPKQHSGAENNKTVSPIPVTTSNTTNTAEVTTSPAPADAVSPVSGSSNTANNAANTATVPAAAAAPPTPTPAITANGVTTNTMGPRPPPRGRGGFGYGRGGGRGGYNMHANGGMGGGMGSYGEHGQMRRGGLSRGRGGYGQPISRAPMHHQHSANTQIAPAPPMKRGAPGGPPGPKRGRFDGGGGYSQRPLVPKSYQTQPHVQQMHSQINYGSQNHLQTQSHPSYVQHDQSHSVDPYGQTYGAAAPQTSYNGYAQSGVYGTQSQQAQQTSASYGHHAANDYDQCQYQTYNSAYGTQQDSRYQAYGQDYTAQYGAPAVDYSSAPQSDYSQQAQGYDERYSGYDSQVYQQAYTNTTGYY